MGDSSLGDAAEEEAAAPTPSSEVWSPQGSVSGISSLSSMDQPAHYDCPKQIREAKTELRKKMRATLASLTPADIAAHSADVTCQVLAHPVWKRARCVALFLSMPTGELDTDALVSEALAQGKKVYVPRCVSKTEMRMLHARSREDIAAFPRSHWGIPEPPLEEDRADVFDWADVDLIIVPGLAFSHSWARLGQGAGYYDRFLTRLFTVQDDDASPEPFIIGVCCGFQFVPKIPFHEHDVTLDGVIYSKLPVHVNDVDKEGD